MLKIKKCTKNSRQKHRNEWFRQNSDKKRVQNQNNQTKKRKELHRGRTGTGTTQNKNWNGSMRGAVGDSPNPTRVGSNTAPRAAAVAAAEPFRPVTPPPPPPLTPLLLQVSSATGRLVGRSLEKELGSRKPWSVGLGVEHCDSPPVSEGGEGESPGPRPPPTP